MSNEFMIDDISLMANIVLENAQGIIREDDNMLHGNIIRVEQDTNTLKVWPAIYDTQYAYAFIYGAIYTDRLRVGLFFKAPKGVNSERICLMSSGENYNPEVNGELTYDNADIKTGWTELNAGNTAYYRLSKSNSGPGTVWYVRPVLRFKNGLHYGDTWKFSIGDGNVITSERIENTFTDFITVTSAYYVKHDMRILLVDDYNPENELYSFFANDGQMLQSEANNYMYALINKADFQEYEALMMITRASDNSYCIIDAFAPIGE